MGLCLFVMQTVKGYQKAYMSRLREEQEGKDLDLYSANVPKIYSWMGSAAIGFLNASLGRIVYSITLFESH